MKRDELIFPRPLELQAEMPPSERGLARDGIRLMVSTLENGQPVHQHAHFHQLGQFLNAGDVLVVNRSATLPASLPAQHERIGDFMLNLSTRYGHKLWLAEPRWSYAQPGPLPLKAGDVFEVGGLTARLVQPFPGLDRLWFVSFCCDLTSVMAQLGRPIRYGYLQAEYPLDTYQTVFASVPGSAEMPSAGYPFTPQLLDDLMERGIQTAGVLLHTGVSSLEVEVEEVESHPLYPEYFEVPAETAEAVNRAHAEGRRVIAVGTTVIRALESAWEGHKVQPAQGFTRLFVHPARGRLQSVNGLITGLHDPVTSHLAMLYALAGQDLVRTAYAEAVREGYLWHEFGDSHLILTTPPTRFSTP
ncbi:MAG: S-adenosylmethionine:tRNA ribosyltransferase-isomerase [Chloroflexi bacterium]|nr:S-adenosylmethionine:tRNA ribosyltransferase-isomerase [Chloroflexota bacterium]